MALGEQLGLTFQQVQKYERGSNRISASRLFKLAHILDVPISYFFEEAEKSVPPPTCAGQKTAKSIPDGVKTSDRSILDRRETLQLVRAYYRIPDHRLRTAIRALVADTAKDQGNSTATTLWNEDNSADEGNAV